MQSNDEDFSKPDRHFPPHSHQILNSSRAAFAAALFLPEGIIGLSEILNFFVHIHAEAYMFTL
jgi:hypothetical protein